MHVLVDYDNVHVSYRQRGLAHVVQAIVDAIGPSVLMGTHRLTVRLYGGWLTDTGTSPAAQRLAGAVGTFPRAVQVTDGTKSVSLIVSVVFAYSLLCEPAVHFPGTYRERSPTNLMCLPGPFASCGAAGACVLNGLPAFINAGRCPEPSCSLLRDDVLSRPEQKLVDTLLIADLLHLAHTNAQDPLVVVSTDDDMWPGIRLALLDGHRVLQIHPVPGRSLHSRFIVRLPSGYSQATLT